MPANSLISRSYQGQFKSKSIAKTNLAAVNLAHNKQLVGKYELAAFRELTNKFNDFSKAEFDLQGKEMTTFKNNRQFITDCFFEVLTAGLSKIKDLNPSDPFEYLVR